MGEKPINFNYIDSHQSYDLERQFTHGDFVKREDVKAYAKAIADELNKIDDADQQHALVLDLLNDVKILETFNNKLRQYCPELLDQNQENEKEISELKRMMEYFVRSIRKQIIEELGAYVSPKLIFFIINAVKEGKLAQNMIVTNNDQEQLFLKKYSFFNEKNQPIFRKNLSILKKAFDNSDEKSPFVVQPIVVGASSKNPVLMVPKKDITTIEDYIEKNKTNVSIRKILLTVVDCLKGAKFLSQSGLTLTDISMTRNIGFDNETDGGLIYDLDGLMQVGHPVTYLIAPGAHMGFTDHVPPEYRDRIIKGDITIKADGRSMIWEIAKALEWIYREINSHGGKLGRLFYEKINSLADKMMSEKPEDRPDFDTCIAELTKIIEENFKEETATQTPAV
ncbi:MAG: hypothetical protein ACD_72C00176G0002 [uncultured bacterium]|nr:MAG: hypothetical protein ACD_72C00176G0002 [uncultured bacterium]